MSDAPYKVGYGKPPVASRFGKGRSGNPAGSSRKRRDANENVLGSASSAIGERLGVELARLVAVTDQGSATDISRLDALVRQFVMMGLRGNRLAVQHVLERADRDTQADHDDRQACYHHWSNFVATQPHRPRHQPYLPEQVHYPHPADIQLRAASLAVNFVGPLDATEAKIYLLPRLIRDYCLVAAVLAGRARARAGSGTHDPDPALVRIALSVHRLIPPSLDGRSLDMDASGDALKVALELLVLSGKNDRTLEGFGFMSRRAIGLLIANVTADANDVRCSPDATTRHILTLLATLRRPEQIQP